MLQRLFEVLVQRKPIRTDEQQLEVDRACRNLTLYHFPGCPYCTRVKRVIRSLRLTLPDANINRDQIARSMLRKGGGQEQVPCLRIADDNGNAEWLYESQAIIDYLKRRFSHE